MCSYIRLGQSNRYWKNRFFDHPHAELDILSFQKTYKWAMETRGPKSNSSKLLCLSWLPATLMMIRSKMNELAWSDHLPIISLWEIFQTSRAANSVVRGWIWPKFELVRDFMHVLVTCKYKKDRIKNNREKVETSFSQLKVNGGFLLPWKPEFWSNLPKTLIQPFPHPNYATYKI